jgi:hypothetical protein
VSGWVVPQAAGVRLPNGIAVAGMGRRTGAYFLDGIFAGLLLLIPTIIALAMGAVSLNQRALDQIDIEAHEPFANVTAPILNVQTGPLIFAAVAYVAIYLIYHVGCWVAFAGSPGQRMLGLWVADLETGNNLTVAAAITRWLALYGLSVLLGGFALVLSVQSLSTIPGRELFGGRNTFGGMNLFSTLISWAGTIWSIVLLVSAGSRPDHRGFHDRWSGSIVVGKAQLVPAPYWPVQGGWQVPGGPAGPYPPQGMPYWPPQGVPPYPGYPGYTGYTGYPNVPQWQPPAGPPAPPATPGESPSEPPPGPPESEPQG